MIFQWANIKDDEVYGWVTVQPLSVRWRLGVIQRGCTLTEGGESGQERQSIATPFLKAIILMHTLTHRPKENTTQETLVNKFSPPNCVVLYFLFRPRPPSYRRPPHYRLATKAPEGHDPLTHTYYTIFPLYAGKNCRVFCVPALLHLPRHFLSLVASFCCHRLLI